MRAPSSSTAMLMLLLREPAGFLREHASDAELFAISFRKLRIYLTFPFVRAGGKCRKEAWL